MDAIDALMTRASVPPRLMTEDGPDGDTIRQLLEAAVRAPDHGNLQPWRFVLIEGDDRRRLGEIFGEALRKRDPAAGQAAIDKEVSRPLRAPVVLAVLARVDETVAKVPVIEQVVAAGAAASNVLLAAHALGWGAIMLTGANAHDAHVKSFFRLREIDEIVGFIYLGAADDKGPGKERTDPSVFVEPFGAESADIDAPG